MQNIIVSTANRALAIPRSEGMERLFPEGKPLNGKLWVIRHGLAEYTVLRRLGFKLPNPIVCYYDWCGGTPFEVQKVTCSLLTASPRAYVLNDMGTGKTRAALWAWDYLYTNKYAGKALIVAPLSTLKLVWANECFGALHHRKAVVLWGATKKKRLDALADPDADIFIINHDGLKVLGDELRQRKDIDVLILDELATYRNASDRSKRIRKFAEPMKFAWGLTGSPMPNEPTDVWQQCRILTPHTVPKYFTHARDELMIKRSEFLWVPKSDAVEKAYSWMQPAVRFTLDDVVELPEIVERYVDVPLSTEQERGYKDMVNNLVAVFQDKEVTAINAAAELGKLLQISGGYVYGANREVAKLDVEPRKEILLELIRSASKKVLLFSPYRHMVTGLTELLWKEGVDVATIHGDIAPGERNKIFEAFQKTPQFKVINAHPGCMSHGLTLTAADTIIWYCPLPNYDIYEQANARIRRVGQKHRQQIIHLQGTPVERKIYALLKRKAKVQDLLLSLFAEATAQAQGG